MKIKVGYLTLAAMVMLMANSSLAQSTSTGGGTTTANTPVAAPNATGSTSTSSAFESLSPGNQKIARALFLAQHASSTGPTPLSLNQIAALKGKEGWGQVFKEMKAEGLVEAKNLGQVVSGYEHHLHSAALKAHSRVTVLTTGSGRAYAAGVDRGHANAAGDRDLATGDDGKQGAMAAGHDQHDDAVTVATANGSGHGVAGGVNQTAGGASAAGGTHAGSATHGR